MLGKLWNHTFTFFGETLYFHFYIEKSLKFHNFWRLQNANEVLTYIYLSGNSFFNTWRIFIEMSEHRWCH